MQIAHKNQQPLQPLINRSRKPDDSLNNSKNVSRAISKKQEASAQESAYLDQYTIDTTSFSGRVDLEDSKDIQMRRKEQSELSQMPSLLQRKYLSNPSHSPIVQRSRPSGMEKAKNYSVMSSASQQPQNRVSTNTNRNRNSSSHLHSISPEKNRHVDVNKKLQQTLMGVHSCLSELLQRKYSPFADITCLSSGLNGKHKVSMNKTFLSSRLDCCIVSKSFDRQSAEKSKRAYEEEKDKHKELEGKIEVLVDLLAYDDIGLRLFYEYGTVNMHSLNQKYIEVSVAFSENDLLCLTRQLVRIVSLFAVNQWYFNGFEDLSSFVFVKASEGYQQYNLKVSNIEKASSDPSLYHFDFSKLNFPKSNTNSVSSPKQSKTQGSTITGKGVREKSSSRNHGSEQPNGQTIQATHTNTSTTHERRSSQQQSQFSIWDRIFGYEIQQICSMIFSIFIKQNAQTKVNLDDNDQPNPTKPQKQIPSITAQPSFEGNPRLEFYLTSLFQEAQNPTNLGNAISQLLNDESIPQTVIIEDTLVEQIRMTESTQPLNVTNAHRSSSTINPIGSPLGASKVGTQADEIRSISMIAVQTANKRYQEELAILRDYRGEAELPKSQDFYESILNISHLKMQNPSTFPFISEVIEEVKEHIDEKTEPFSFAEILLSQAYMTFKMKTQGSNPMQLAKHCNSIVNEVQNNEINEICGNSYLIMSEMAARSTSHRNRALEYAIRSYDIRKQVHGPQSRSIEIVDSLLQVARMYVLKGSYEESTKYFEKAAKIVEELKGGPHRIAVEILTEHALALFNLENYGLCVAKCEQILEAEQKSADHLISYCFPFAMNLLSLARIMEDLQIPKPDIENGIQRQLIEQSMKAVKIAVDLRGPEQQTQQSLIQQMNSSQQTTATSEKATLQLPKTIGISNGTMSSIVTYYNQLQQLQTYFSKDIGDMSSLNLPQIQQRIVIDPRQRNGQPSSLAQIALMQPYQRQISQARNSSLKSERRITRTRINNSLSNENNGDLQSFYQ